MTRLCLSSDIRPVSDLRSNFSDFIDQVHETKRPIVITQHGKSTAVLLDVSEYERIMDKLELIEDIDVATAQIKQGHGIPHDEVRKRLGAGKRK